MAEPSYSKSSTSSFPKMFMNLLPTPLNVSNQLPLFKFLTPCRFSCAQTCPRILRNSPTCHNRHHLRPKKKEFLRSVLLVYSLQYQQARLLLPLLKIQKMRDEKFPLIRKIWQDLKYSRAALLTPSQMTCLEGFRAIVKTLILWLNKTFQQKIEIHFWVQISKKLFYINFFRMNNSNLLRLVERLRMRKIHAKASFFLFKIFEFSLFQTKFFV